ncbi:MAG: hypothetical protein WCK51_01170 [Armatimonadota bacterium]
MYVPNYVPEPEAMPGNVTQERYSKRLLFIRETFYRFCLWVLVIALLAWAIPTEFGREPRFGWLWLLSLALISLLRTFGRGTTWEVKSAPIQALVCIGTTALAARSATAFSFPAWSVLAGIGCFAVYAIFCGRDFSFVGGYVLALIASSTIIAFIMIEEALTSLQSWQAILWNAFALLYLVYDLASLMCRRKVTEVTAASVDLFRDIFNPFGWVPRVIMHWYRHRILNDLSFDLPFRRWLED